MNFFLKRWILTTTNILTCSKFEHIFFPLKMECFIDNLSLEYYSDNICMIFFIYKIIVVICEWYSGRGGCSSPLNLPLEVRLKIAKGIARGLAFIHDKKHVHGNIKPTNILLNTENEPIISDFGLDRLRPAGSSSARPPVHQVSNIGSSSGTHQLNPYKAPESLQSPQPKPKPKWDVYSFGVVLLELLTGRVFSDRELDRSGSMEEEKNRVLRMVDVAIRKEVESREVVLVCLKLGFSCASVKPQKRPSMKDVLQVLEKIPNSSQ